MPRIERNFRSRPESEQAWLCEHTWCDNCRSADIGMSDPVEYEEDGVVRVEGRCLQCAMRVVSEVHDRHV